MASCFIPGVEQCEDRKLLSGVQVVYGPHTATIEQLNGTPIFTAFTPQPGTLHYLNIHGVNLEGVDLSGMDFSGSAFHDIDLRGANLQNVNFSRCAFWQPDLTQADLRGANLSHVVSWEAVYSDAVFTGDDLSTWWDSAPIDGWGPILTYQAIDPLGNTETLGGLP